jgi:hypothetical protein
VSDGPSTGPADEHVRRAGTPPVPRPAGGDPSLARDGDDGRHRTQQVPLPPTAAPPVVAPGPATGRLQLGGYPPRVPGAPRTDPRPAAQPPEDAPSRSAQLPDGGADDDR